MGEPRIDELWREIASIPPPKPMPVAPLDIATLVPKPPQAALPAMAVPIGLWTTWGAVFGGTAALFVQAPHLVWLGLFPAAGAATWQLIRRRPLRKELRRRRDALATAKRRHSAVVAEVDSVGRPGFVELKDGLRRLQQEYETEIPNRQARALAAFEEQARSRQLHSYLERSYISDAVICGLGPSRKETLQRHGISSAAQVDDERIVNLPGFGPVLTYALLDWKLSRVRAFKFKPGDPVTLKERASAIAPFDARRDAIRLELEAGRDKLQRLSRPPADESARLARQLAAAAQAVAQAELDVSALKRTTPARRPPGPSARARLANGRSHEA